MAVYGGNMKKSSSLKEFFYYIITNVIGMIGLSCYILADTFFVSKGLGTNGLTALNLAIPIYSFVHGSGNVFFFDSKSIRITSDIFGKGICTDDTNGIFHVLSF